MFNCTNVVDCLDLGRTQTTEDGRIKLEAVDESKVPADAAVFKAPQTARVRNDVNDAAKAVIEQWAGEAGLTGIEIAALDAV